MTYALSTGMASYNSLDDVRFVHNSLPETSVSRVDVSVTIGELSLSSPIIINAMTGGGGKETEVVNSRMAAAAAGTGTAMAVGSQMAALKDERESYTYKTVRSNHPNGVIFANLGSELTIQQAREAVEMLEADALQIHLNVIQELVMPEGDRDFRGALHRIAEVAAQLEVPVIVKEVGFGMSREAAALLKEAGIKMIDTGGHGGTNFAAIENKRRTHTFSFFNEWGITTAASIIEAVHACPSLFVIGSGGIRNGADMAKAIALGAEGVGMAGNVLAAVQKHGQKGAEQFLQNCIEELKMIMAATGAETISQLQTKPLVITGKTKEWLNERGINTKRFSQRDGFSISDLSEDD